MTVTNRDRAEWARNALGGFRRETKCDYEGSTAFCVHCKYTGPVSGFDAPSTDGTTGNEKGGAA